MVMITRYRLFGMSRLDRLIEEDVKEVKKFRERENERKKERQQTRKKIVTRTLTAAALVLLAVLLVAGAHYTIFSPTPDSHSCACPDGSQSPAFDSKSEAAAWGEENCR